MGKGSNALTHKQVYMLCKWIESIGSVVKGKKADTLARYASKELNFFVTDHNIRRAIDIVGVIDGSLETPCFDDQVDDAEHYSLKFRDGAICDIHRIEDGYLQTTVFFPEGPVVNSYPQSLFITLEDRDRTIIVRSFDKKSQLWEEISISKDQSLVSRSVTERQAEAI
ncbi:MAG: hypothetical protein RBS34_02665 [Desulfofustis sp.]|jgi:hypothetical protein|nr:hypothetical protein [Desulfofustis sp.]